MAVKDLVIIGAGGFGRETKALVDEINAKEMTWNFLGYVAENCSSEVTLEGDRILGDLEFLFNMSPKPHIVICIADWRNRKRLAKLCRAADMPVATLIHPSVEIKGDLCQIGEGSILCDHVSLAVNTKIGEFCILNMLCGIGHDTELKNYVSMMSRTIVGGDTVIGEGCYFGLRCTVINKLNITPWCTFGAGSVVVKNAEEAGTYVGIPAKMIKKLVVTE